MPSVQANGLLISKCGKKLHTSIEDEVGGSILKAIYESYYDEQVAKLMEDADLYGDGAMIKTTPLINVIASSPSNPSCVLNVIDCSKHMIKGGVKGTKFISLKMLKVNSNITNLGKQDFIQILFNGALNLVKAGEIMT